jgi:hypothetical protein
LVAVVQAELDMVADHKDHLLLFQAQELQQLHQLAEVLVAVVLEVEAHLEAVLADQAAEAEALVVALEALEVVLVHQDKAIAAVLGQVVVLMWLLVAAVVVLEQAAQLHLVMAEMVCNLQLLEQQLIMLAVAEVDSIQELDKQHQAV